MPVSRSARSPRPLLTVAATTYSWSRTIRTCCTGTSRRPSGRFPPSAPFRAVLQRDLASAEVQDRRRHGRRETRLLEVVSVPPGYLEWPGVARICQITRRREGAGGTTVQVVHALTSLPRGRATAADLLALN